MWLLGALTGLRGCWHIPARAQSSTSIHAIIPVTCGMSRLSHSAPCLALHPQVPLCSPSSGAVVSAIRKQCILLKFRDSRRTHPGGRTMVRSRPKVHSGASIAEHSE